jgi:hypothetical protein
MHDAPVAVAGPPGQEEVALVESRLYRNAVSALGTQRATWQRARKRLEAVACAQRDDWQNGSGAATLALIRTEHQLSADPANAHPEPMREMLERLCNLDCTRAYHDVVKAYGTILEPFALKGTLIHTRPATLYRYLNGPGLFSAMIDGVEPMHPKLARKLRHEVRVVKRGDSVSTWQRVLAELSRPSVWAALPRASIKLARARSMFVTFDGTPSPPTLRARATVLHAAAAMWRPRHPCFVEASYPSEPTDELRFPTFADAGWFRFFRSAPHGEPHGWTHPHRWVRLAGSPLPPQPEAVQETLTLARLAGASSLRVVDP